MRFLDCAGPPGCGKSTLCYKNSDGTELWGDRSVTWDGKNPPAYWKPFLEELTNLMALIQDHPSISAVLRMNDRSAKKMATVERMEAPEGKFPVFVQTGLVQRILGFGWRLHDLGRDVNLIRRSLWLMPVSVGVAILEADLETLLQRNRDRENNPATSWENRSYQVPHMLACMPLVKEVMAERGIPTICIDVQRQSIPLARSELLAFADRPVCEAAKMTANSNTQIIVPPPWWG